MQREKILIQTLSMNRLTIKDLQRLSIHCGYRTDITKPARLREIAESRKFYDDILAQQNANSPLNILSIDVGIKNFSYSKVSYTGKHVEVKEWTVMNLHDRYGTPGYTGEGSLVESKAYMAKLALSVVDNVLVTRSWVPNVITVENQRTRSNTSKSTLPNVLLNFTLEHMLYAAFAARQSTNADYSNTTVVPMNSNKMASYWVSRYIAKSCVYSPSRSKMYRRSMLYGWFENSLIAPFDFSSFTNKLPSKYSTMSTAQKNCILKSMLDITKKDTKVDDLVDSFLYNLTFARHISHHEEIGEFDDKDRILESLTKWDKEHIGFVRPLIRSMDDLYLADEYEKLEKSNGPDCEHVIS